MGKRGIHIDHNSLNRMVAYLLNRGFGLFGFFVAFTVLLMISTAQADSGNPFLPTLKPKATPQVRGLFSAPDYQLKTLNRMNYHRTLAGLDTLSLQADLNDASQGHADYLGGNNLSGHYQNETSFPLGFTGVKPADRATAEGYEWGGIGEAISLGHDAEGGVDSLMTAIYHRFILLGIGYTEVGVGDNDSHPAYNFVQVINPARPKGTDEPQNVMAIYPKDGQTDVPLKFNSDEESPDPIDSQNTVGYPVSIQFSSDYAVTLTNFTLSKDGVPLNAKILEKTTDDNISKDDYAVISYATLEPETQYEAEFTGTVNGASFQKTWSFTTGATPVLSASVSSLNIGVGGDGEITLTNADGKTQFGWDDASIIDVDGGVGSTLTVSGKKAGTTTLTISDESQSSVAVAVTVSASSPTFDISLGAGWNLASSRIGFKVADHFSESIKFVSVWKWSGVNWFVYLPGEDTSSYAASKGFSVLSSISPGEGFWVNSVGSETVSFSGATGEGSISVAKDWNLLGLKGSQDKALTSLISGKESNLVSLWKWSGSAWSVYLPDETDGGSAYAQGKGFNLLSTLSPGEGFWVNAGSAVTLD